MHHFEYTVDDIQKFSNFRPDYLRQAVSRDGVKLANIADVAIWLSANGKPKIRAEMARNLLPAVFGLEKRSTRDTAGLLAQISNLDLLLEIFKRADASRHARAKGISKNRASG